MSEETKQTKQADFSDLKDSLLSNKFVKAILIIGGISLSVFLLGKIFNISADMVSSFKKLKTACNGK